MSVNSSSIVVCLCLIFPTSKLYNPAKFDSLCLWRDMLYHFFCIYYDWIAQVLCSYPKSSFVVVNVKSQEKMFWWRCWHGDLANLYRRNRPGRRDEAAEADWADISRGPMAPPLVEVPGPSRQYPLFAQQVPKWLLFSNVASGRDMPASEKPRLSLAHGRSERLPQVGADGFTLYRNLDCS